MKRGFERRIEPCRQHAQGPLFDSSVSNYINDAHAATSGTLTGHSQFSSRQMPMHPQNLPALPVIGRLHCDSSPLGCPFSESQISSAHHVPLSLALRTEPIFVRSSSMDSLPIVRHSSSLLLPALLPTEVIEEVIDQASDDFETLHRLALLCKSLLTRARFHLFTSIVIRTVEQMEASREFLDSHP